MFERDVTISLNADVSNYTSSLSQAIAITQQYSSAADSALGTVAKLNAGLVGGLTKLTSGLTGPQKVVTDTAAAYQQQLSGIQATAAVTGKSFDQLDRSTRALARSFPIGMGQAVQQVQALQSAGVTSEKQIEKLAISFTKLGAANNSFGPELGQQLLQVSRAFGNGTGQIDALGDSLTTVSKQWGANASGVLTFSKAIAPIASTMGMSQTQVMGLSAAMSRLGEDGYMAANSFNKVLLDMNRGIREGGPELKVYADLLNMTSDSLKNLIKNDPTEVLMRFTESVAKAGPDAQRTLEALGLDGIRTTRSITALARSGNLREIVNTAVQGYGSGSTAVGAEEAFSGVNDQMTRLSESMRQTVASAGKPYLGFMEDVLKVANGISKVTNNIMENEGVQKLATVGIVGGVGASLLMKGLTATSLGSLAVNTFRGAQNSAATQQFRAAQDAARGGAPVAGGNAATRLGTLVGTVQGPAPAPGSPGVATTWRERAALTARAAAGTASTFVRTDANSMAQAAGRQAPFPITPAGAAARAAIIDATRTPAAANIAAAAAASRGYAAELVQRGGAARLAGTGLIYGREALQTAAAGTRAGLGAAGRFLGGLGVTPQLAAVAGAGAAGYALYRVNSETNDRLASVRENSTQDIFSSFNNFAEAAGMAGRGLVDFTAAVQSATNSLAKGNSTFAQAGTLTGEEAAQAAGPGYQRAFSIVGEAASGGPSRVGSVVQQALATLGPDASPDMVARIVSDVANQTNTNFANEVGRSLADRYASDTANIDVSTVLTDIQANASSMGYIGASSEESSQLATQMGRGLSQQAYAIGQVYGPEAAAISNVSTAQELYDEARRVFGPQIMTSQVTGTMTTPQVDESVANVGKSLQAMLNLSDEQMQYIFGGDTISSTKLATMDWKAIEDRAREMEGEGLGRPDFLNAIDEANKRGIDLADPSYESFTDRTSVEKSAYDMQASFEEVTGTSSSLSDSLYGINDAARAAGVTLAKLATMPAERSRLAPTEDLVLEAVTNKNEGTVNAAAEALARQALEEAGGNVSAASARLRQEQALAQEGTTYKGITEAASAQLQNIAAPRQAALPQTRTMLEQYRQGVSARQMGTQADFGMEQARQGDIAQGAESQAAFTSMARNFLMQQKQMEVQMQQMREQAGQQTYQMTRDYNLQVQYANEDFNKNRFRATRDFNISMNRMDRDYGRQRQRATRDYERQTEYAEQDYRRGRRRAFQDYNLSMSRMERDYNKQRSRSLEDFAIGTARAERDYQRSRARATRDFNLSMNRMEEDYNRQKDRATADYGKSVVRAEADYLLSRNRATRDFDLQQLYSQQDFQKSRTRSVQDFNKQMRRLVEDQAKSLYDPYKRIQAQLVMDAGQLVANLADQNRALGEQMQTVDRLKQMGLSGQAIDVLGLSDTKNAQQAMRLLADAMGDPALIQQINEQISGRINLTGMFASDSDNQQTRRMQEDFAEQMRRSEEDYTTSSQRAADQFATAMADMDADYKTQMARGAEDFTLAMDRMQEDYATAVTRARADQAQALTDMAEDHRIAMSDAADDLALTLSRMAADYQTTVNDAAEDFRTAMTRMDEDYLTAVERSRRQFMTLMRDMRIDFRTARRDAKEDFDRQMADSEKDFQTQMKRMATSLANALSDIGAGLAIAERAAAQSLIAYGQTVAKGEQAIFRDFGEYIAGLPKDLQKNMGESMKDMLIYMRDRFPTLFREIFPNGIAGIVPGVGPSIPLPPPSARDEGAGPPNPDPLGVGGTPGSYAPGSPQNDPLGVGGTTGSYVQPGSREAQIEQWRQMGEESMEGYVEGLSAFNPARWVMEAVQGVIGSFKRLLGIASPSKVFMGIGEDTMGGFLKGIVDTVPNPTWFKDIITGIFSTAGAWLSNVDEWIGDRIGNKWDELKANMPDLGKAVRDLFTDPGKFFTDLKTWIPEKLGRGWDKITADLPDVNKAVRLAFADPGTFFSNLKTWIPEKIGKGWDKITAGIPGADAVKEAVKGAFKQAETWFNNFDQWVKQALPGWTKFTDLFKAILVTPMETAVNYLIGKWNDFRLSLGPLEVTVLGKTVSVGPWSIDTPNMPPVNWYAQGGIVSGAQVIGVGEAGPEAVIPLNQRGAQVMADAMKTYLGETLWGGSLSSPLGSPSVINVEMADINLDFTDSGSEFSMQAKELLKRITDAAGTAHSVMSSSGEKITTIINSLTASLVDLGKSIGAAFSTAAQDIEADTKSISDSIKTMVTGIDTDLGNLVTEVETDLTSITTEISTSVTTIISETDRLIAAAIQRIEDFANTDYSTGGGDGGTGGGDGGSGSDGGTGGGGDGGSGGGDGGTGGGDSGGGTGSVRWNAFSADYNSLGAPDKTFVDSLFGGKAPSQESFDALSSTKQDALHRAIIGGLTEGERTELRTMFPGGGQPSRDTSFANYSTLQKAVSQSDQDFLTAQFGGAAPTSKTWSKVNASQRDALIAALEDANIDSTERAAIKKLSLPNLGGGTGGGGDSTEPDKGGDPAQQSWDVFREGYRKLGESDQALVDKVFGGKPTFESWKTLTDNQQRKLRDIVRDGSIGKDEKEDVKGLDAYALLGPQIVKYARSFEGTPYKPEVGKSPEQDPANPPSSFDCSKFTSYVYRKFGKSIDSYSDTQYAGGVPVAKDDLMAGDLMFWNTNSSKITGHVGIYAGNGMVIHVSGAVKDTVYEPVSSASSSKYMGARRYFAEGGIVNRRQEAVIGEAGPEVVVPLNERGAEFFASAMQRYATPADARQAMVSPYSTPVSVSITQTYDNRTMFTGPIEVQANDPDELAAKAAAKQRRQRLSQPVGSGR